MDVIFAENFEGIPTQRLNWTDTEWGYVHQILNAVLLNPFSEQSKQLMVTKQFFQPFQDIQKISNFLQDGIPKYRLYSAHDTNIANFLEIFNPPYGEDHIPYAANLILEVYEKSTNSLFVRTMYNGQQLNLENCSNPDCPIYEFIVHMEHVLYMYDLKAKCATDPSGEPKFLEY